MFVRGVCEDVCVLQQDLAPRTGLLEPLPLFLCPLSSLLLPHVLIELFCLYVCVCWHGESVVKLCSQSFRGPLKHLFFFFFFFWDESNIRLYSLCLSNPLLLHALFHFNTTSHSFQADKKHQSGLSIAKTHISHILSNFLLIFPALCQKAGVLCFDDCLDHSLKPFSPAKFDLFKHCLHWLRAYISWNHSSLSPC